MLTDKDIMEFDSQMKIWALKHPEYLTEAETDDE